ncbi:MAG: general secretion pathway protein C [Desulfobacteraceae bacterium Eth-SRB1]|nr:MAG: general secretion pathway protein C [Desulfobacteraceae bacterium Eth-SRB1]
MMIRYRIIFILAAITAMSYLCVDIFYKTVEAKLSGFRAEETSSQKTVRRKAARKPSLNTYRVISDRNLFGSIDKAGEKIKIDIEGLEDTKLGLSLLGTVSGAGEFDFAVIKEKNEKKHGLFREGDAVASATIIRIMRGMVVLRVDGRDEILKMEEGDQRAEGRGFKNVIKVNKRDINSAFKNMEKILAQVRIRPYFSSGKPDGFMVSRIKPESIFQKMGMQNGDIIQGVDNQPIKSPDEMLKLYNGLKSGAAITLNIKRKGRTQNLKYVFQ